MKRFFAIYFVFAIIACNNGEKRDDTLLAEAGTHKLYISDLSKYLLGASTHQDSANVIAAHTSAWLRRQLVADMAEKSLSKEEKNVEKEVDDYRSSLLIYRYKQDYIAKNTDTTITDADIEQLYNQNKNLFTLQQPMVKAKMIKIQTAAPDTETLKKIFTSTKNADRQTVDSIGKTSADKYDDFGGKWITINDLRRLLPAGIDIDDYEKKTLQLKYYLAEDESYLYFVTISDIAQKGSPAPVESQKENIKTLIVNQRKNKLASTLEEKIYDDAVKNGDAKIYINEITKNE